MKIKIRLLFLLVFSSQYADSQNNQASLLEKEITLEVVNAPVATVLKQIEKQIHLRFSYNSEIIDNTRLVTVSFKKKKLNDIISHLFEHTIKCKVMNKYIILYAGNQRNPHPVSVNRSYNKGVNEKNGVKNALPKDTAVFFQSLNNSSDTSDSLLDRNSVVVSLEKDSIGNPDSLSALFAPLILINNDTTLLFLQEDTLALPNDQILPEQQH